MDRRVLFGGIVVAVVAGHAAVLWRPAAPAVAQRGHAPAVTVRSVVRAAPVAVRVPAVPKPRAPAPPSSPTADAGRYFARAEVERAALPRSAPDVAMLTGLPASGLPIRLQVFVGATGTVDDVRVLQAVDDDAELVEGIRRMLRATAFLPARRAGQDVASVLELAFDLGGT